MVLRIINKGTLRTGEKQVIAYANNSDNFKNKIIMKNIVNKIVKEGKIMELELNQE